MTSPQTSRRFLAKLAARRASRRAALLLPLGAGLFAGQAAQAVNVVYTETSTGTVTYSAAIKTPAGTPGVGDVLQYNTAATANLTTLDVALTLGGLRNTNTGAFSFLTDGTNVLTLDATGLTTAGNQLFGNAGTAFIGTSSSGALTVTTPLSIANTNLDIGSTSTGVVTIGGAITATTAQAINFRANNNAASIAVTGAIGVSGSNLAISNLGTATGVVSLRGALGTSVTTVTQNSATSTLNLGFNGTGTLAVVASGATTVTLSAANPNLLVGDVISGTGIVAGTTITAINGTTLTLSQATTAATVNTGGAYQFNASASNSYAGGTTLNVGTLSATSAAATNQFLALGTGTVTLNGGTLQLRANGSGTTGIITGNGTTGNNVVVGGNATINTNNAGGTNTNSTFVFNNLSIGANTLTVTPQTNGYGVRFAGTTTLTGSPTINVAGGLTTTLSGAVGESGGSFGITKTGSSTLTLNGNNTFTGAFTSTAGTANFTGTNATPTVTARNGSITVSGANGALGSATALTVANGTLTLDNAAANNNDRLTGNVTLLNNGTFVLTGNGATAGTQETIGTLTTALGNNTVTIGGAGAGQIQQLTAGAFARTDGATALVRGTTLGVTATNSTRLLLSSLAGVPQIGTVTSAGGAGTTTNLTIIPYLVGDSSVTGLGRNFVTYDTTTGLRPLDAAEATLISAGVTGDNVKTAAGANAVTGPQVFNSLLVGAGAANTPATTAATVTGDGTGTLTLTSGALANVATSATGGGTVSGFTSIIFGTTGANEAIITNTNGTAGGTLAINSPVNTAAAGGGLTKAGAGVVELGAVNLYTGTTTVNQGTLQFATGNNNALNGGAGGAVQVNGGTLNLNGTTQAVGAVGLANSGVLSGAASTLNLGGTITYNATANASTGGTISVANLNLNGARTVNVGDSVGAGTDLTVSSVVANGTGTGAIEKTGAGTLNLTGANTFSGAYTATAGTTIINSISTGTGPGAATASAIGTGVLTLNGGTIASSGGTGGRTLYNNIVANTNTSSTFDLAATANGANFVLNGNLSSSVAGGGTATGGTVNFTSTGNQNGSFTVANGNAVDWSGFSGVLNYAVNSATAQNLIFQPAGVGTLDLSNATVNLTNVGAGTNSSFSNGGAAGSIIRIGALTGNSAAILSGSNVANVFEIGNLNTNTTYAGLVGGNAAFTLSLRKVGSGTLTLSGTNAYTGTTTVSAGTLQFANGRSLYNSGATLNAAVTAANITVESGATLALNVDSATASATTGFTAAEVATIAALGTGTTGFKSGAILGLDTSTATGGSFAFATVLANPNGGANVLGLTKLGAGTLNLTAANTYTGGTNVNAGTLRVNNTTGSGVGTGPVAVNLGAVLGGGAGTANGGTLTGPTAGASLQTYAPNVVGILTATVTVNAGGTLAPGNSVGTLTAVNLTLNNASLLSYEFNGTANDFTSVTNTLTLAGTSIFTLLQEGTATAFNTPGTYNLIGYTTEVGTPRFAVANADPGFNYVFNDTGSLIQLTVTPVPEPGTWVMMVGGGLLLVGLQGRRRRHQLS